MDKKLNILLATDYSEAIMNAERYAFEFAKKTNSTLTVVHVYDIPFSLPVESTEYMKESDRLRKFELQKLHLHCETLMNSLHIKQDEINWECLVLEGQIEKEIRKEAERTHPDLIITGTHGGSGLRDLFQSSHTWEIIKKSNVPILSIPQDGLLTDIKKIVFATEYREGEIPGIQFLVKFAKQFDAELTVLHISTHSLTKEYESELLEKFKTAVQNKVIYEKLNLKLIYADDVIKGLNEYCVLSNTDWLAMSHSKPFALENILLPSKSKTKEMSIQSTIPLLSIPDYYAAEQNNETEAVSETIYYNHKK